MSETEGPARLIVPPPLTPAPRPAPHDANGSPSD